MYEFQWPVWNIKMDSLSLKRKEGFGELSGRSGILISSNSRILILRTDIHLAHLLQQSEFLTCWGPSCVIHKCSKKRHDIEAFGVAVMPEVRLRCKEALPWDRKIAKNPVGCSRSHVLIICTQSSWETQFKWSRIDLRQSYSHFRSPAYLISWWFDVHAAFGQSRFHSDEKGTLKGVVSG